jgi:hypothetical protein
LLARTLACSPLHRVRLPPPTQRARPRPYNPQYSKYTTRAAYEIHAIQDALAVAHGGADAQTVRALDERLRTFWHVVRLVAPPYFHIDDAAALAALRPWEETELVTVTAGRYSYEAVIDVTADTQMRAASSIGLTTYILLLLITAVFLFNRVSVRAREHAPRGRVEERASERARAHTRHARAGRHTRRTRTHLSQCRRKGGNYRVW